MRDKKGIHIFVVMLSLCTLMGAFVMASTNATAVLTSSETAWAVGDRFTLTQTSSNDKYPRTVTITVTGEETVDGVLCSIANVVMTYRDTTHGDKIWYPKTSITKDQYVKYGSSDYRYTISSAPSSIGVGDSWSQTFTYIDSSSHTSNSTSTKNYRVLSDSTVVTVPAGTFRCHVINSSAPSSNFSYTLYYISGKYQVKTENYYRNYTTGNYDLSLTTVLVSHSIGNDILAALGFTGSSTSDTVLMIGYGLLVADVIILAVALAAYRKAKKLQPQGSDLSGGQESESSGEAKAVSVHKSGEHEVRWDDTPIYKPVTVSCRKCTTQFTIISPQRPITVTCPKCRTSGIVRK